MKLHSHPISQTQMTETKVMIHSLQKLPSDLCHHAVTSSIVVLLEGLGLTVSSYCSWFIEIWVGQLILPPQSCYQTLLIESICHFSFSQFFHGSPSSLILPSDTCLHLEFFSKWETFSCKGKNPCERSHLAFCVSLDIAPQDGTGLLYLH